MNIRFAAVCALAVLLSVAVVSPARSQEAPEPQETPEARDTRTPVEAAPGSLLERVVDVPRDTQVMLDMSFGDATLISVESRNLPTEDEVRKAQGRDPKDRTRLILRVWYRNSGYVKRPVSIRGVILDANDVVLGEGGRPGSLSKRKERDTFSFMVSVRTKDWPRAAKLKIFAAFKD